jgi:hypothetical protein
MPRDRKTIEFRPEDTQHYNALVDFFGVSDTEFTAQFRSLLDRCYAHNVLGAELKPVAEIQTENDVMADENPCDERHKFNGVYYCDRNWLDSAVKKPKPEPLQTLIICEKCIQRKLERENGLPSKTRIAKETEFAEPEPAPLIPENIDIPDATQKLFFAHYDHGKHCPFTTHRILMYTCGECSRQNKTQWLQCQALRASLKAIGSNNFDHNHY